jgi:hypothetical protein
MPMLSRPQEVIPIEECKKHALITAYPNVERSRGDGDRRLLGIIRSTYPILN